jgi:hypothetical protein
MVKATEMELIIEIKAIPTKKALTVIDYSVGGFESVLLHPSRTVDERMNGLKSENWNKGVWASRTTPGARLFV